MDISFNFTSICLWECFYLIYFHYNTGIGTNNLLYNILFLLSSLDVVYGGLKRRDNNQGRS